MEDLPLKCDCGCNETEKKNVIKEDIDGEMFEVEWSEYCKKCGKYLGSHIGIGNIRITGYMILQEKQLMKHKI